MPELSNDARAIIDAIQDLTRVTLALQGNFASRSDAIRRLDQLSIPSGRIAAILSMPVGDVASAIAKAKKRNSPISEDLHGRGDRSRKAGQTGNGISSNGVDTRAE